MAENPGEFRRSITAELKLEDEEEKESYCMPTKTVSDKLMIVALVFVIIGLVLSTVGYLTPNEYVFNGDLPAREMEAIQIRYTEMSHILNMCIIVGMSFVAVGGLLTMVVFTYTVLLGDCMNKRSSNTLLRLDGVSSVTYGTLP